MSHTRKLSTGWTLEKLKAHINENGVLENADLSGLDLSWMVIEDMTFRGVKFTDADLSRSVYSDCVFENCDLTRVCVTGATLQHVEMTDCDISDIGASFTKWDLCSLDRCTGTLVNLAGAKLNRFWWTEVTLTDSAFITAELKDVKFERSTLRRLEFERARFENVSVYSSDLYCFELEHSTVINSGVWQSSGDPAVVLHLINRGWFAPECLVVTNLLGDTAAVIPRNGWWLIYLDGWWGTLKDLRKALAENAHPVESIDHRALDAKSLDVRHREVEAFANFAEVWMETHADVLDAYCARSAEQEAKP